MAAQDRIYARALSRHDPVIVAAACEDWARTKQFWPELSELLALCREHEGLAEVAARPRLAAPEAPITRRENMTDERLLKAWAVNDGTAEAIRKSPGQYACAAALLAAHANFRQRRFRERPDLAARYYGAEA